MKVGNVEVTPMVGQAPPGRVAYILASPGLAPGVYRLPTVLSHGFGTASYTSVVEEWDSRFDIFFLPEDQMVKTRAGGHYLVEKPFPRWARPQPLHDHLMDLIRTLHGNPNPIGWAPAPAAVSKRCEMLVFYALHGDTTVAILAPTERARLRR